MKRRVNVRGVIVNDKGELFCQRLTARNSDGRDFWCTPGGGLDLGEEITDGLKREMIEETGISPEIGSLLFIQQFAESGENSAHGPNEQLEFFFHITNWQDYETINLEATSHGVAEIAECGFVDPKTTHVLPAKLREIDVAAVIAQAGNVAVYTEF